MKWIVYIVDNKVLNIITLAHEMHTHRYNHTVKPNKQALIPLYQTRTHCKPKRVASDS